MQEAGDVVGGLAMGPLMGGQGRLGSVQRMPRRVRYRLTLVCTGESFMDIIRP